MDRTNNLHNSGCAIWRESNNFSRTEFWEHQGPSFATAGTTLSAHFNTHEHVTCTHCTMSSAKTCTNCNPRAISRVTFLLCTCCKDYGTGLDNNKPDRKIRDTLPTLYSTAGIRELPARRVLARMTLYHIQSIITRRKVYFVWRVSGYRPSGPTSWVR